MLVSGRVPAELTLEKQIRLFYLFIDPAYHLAIIPIPCNVGGVKEPENLEFNHSVDKVVVLNILKKLWCRHYDKQHAYGCFRK